MTNTTAGSTRPDARSGNAAAADSPRPQRGNGHVQDPPAEGFFEQGERLRDEANLLATHVGDVVGACGALVRDQLDQRLYTTLLSAAGLGYVLGGGLPLRVVTLAVGLGLRQMGGQAFTRLLLDDVGRARQRSG